MIERTSSLHMMEWEIAHFLHAHSTLPSPNESQSETTSGILFNASWVSGSHAGYQGKHACFRLFSAVVQNIGIRT